MIYRATITGTWATPKPPAPQGTFVGLVDAADVHEALSLIGENIGRFENGANKAQDVGNATPRFIPPLAHMVECIYLHIEKVSDKAFLARVEARRKVNPSTDPSTFDHWVFPPSWQS